MSKDENLNEFFKLNNDETFKDEIIVGKLGALNLENLLEYFSYSHFYISNNINERCKLKNIDMNTNKIEIRGYEYTLLRDKTNPFVILLSYKNMGKETKLAYYFCWPDGTICMAPSIYNHLSSFVHSIASECEEIKSILNVFD